VAIDNGAVTGGNYWNAKAELFDGADHPIHNGIILTGIAGVLDQFIKRPVLEGERCHRLGFSR
jgi:hypothetical protein